MNLMCALAMITSLAAANSFAAKDIVEQASQLELQGRFKEAAEFLKPAMEDKSMAPAERKRLGFELDRLQRIKKDFPYTKDELFAELKKSVKGLAEKEFEQWIAEGRFDGREIDGERYFMSSSVSNLYFRYPELNARRIEPKDNAAHEKRILENAIAIKKAALSGKEPYVLPKRFHVTMTVTAKSNAAPAGKVIRAWLPVPRRHPFQEDFQLVSTSSSVKHLDDEQSPIRAIYFEQPARKNQPTEFKIEYNYTTYGVYFDLKPENIRSPDLNDAELKRLTGEAPHVVFTPEINALSEQVAGGEKNPMLQAKKFYDWIAGNIKYSYAIEYSTIRNISEYCRTKGYGDCGQEALLFITLCRFNGIPARWQSGWNTSLGHTTIHDWTEIHLPPYGWIPVDPYMGIWAMRYATSLTPTQKVEVRDFYFGGVDQYRMAANSDHNQVLNPPKQSMRSDDVDFQRGELEYDGTNIYFDQYSYDLKWTEAGKSEEQQGQVRTFRR